MPRLGVGEVIGATFRTVFRNFPTFLRTQGVLVLATGLLVVVLSLTLGIGSAMLFEEGETALAWTAVAVGAVGLFLALCILVAALGVGVHVADAALRGERIRLADAWTLARPRAPNLLATALAGGLAALALSLAVYAPFTLGEPPSLDVLTALVLTMALAVYVVDLYLLARWGPALPVAALEKRSPLGNYAEASALTTGSRGALMGANLAPLLGYAALGIAVAVAIAELPDAGTSALATPAAVVASALALVAWLFVALLVTFLWTTLTVVAYRRLALPATTDFEVLPEDEPSFVP